MDTMQPDRVIFETEPGPGSWNMAVDEALLQDAIEQGISTLRWYRWSEPTLSLGYFQTLTEVPAALRQAELPIIRRLSGGGAILHHHELTYSLAIAAKHPLASDPHALYRSLHERIIAILGELGILARLRGTHSADGIDPAAFLCFSRSDANDVVLSGHKILGSAQRRRRGAILQHGGLVLQRSPHAPQFPGLHELSLKGTDCSNLPELLLNGMQNLLQNPAIVNHVPGSVFAKAQELQQERYSSSNGLAEKPQPI